MRGQQHIFYGEISKTIPKFCCCVPILLTTFPPELQRNVSIPAVRDAVRPSISLHLTPFYTSSASERNAETLKLGIIKQVTTSVHRPVSIYCHNTQHFQFLFIRHTIYRTLYMSLLKATYYTLITSCIGFVHYFRLFSLEYIYFRIKE